MPRIALAVLCVGWATALGCQQQGTSSGEPAATTGEIRIATWNLEWFFDHDTRDNESDLAREQSAPDAAEYEARVAGFAEAIASMDPHVLAVQEVEDEQVVADVADRLESAHGLRYRVLFVQGRDSHTEQDVACLVKDGVTATPSRFDFAFAGDDRYKDLSKHLRITASVQGHTLEIVTVHLVTSPADRLRQARTLREWTESLDGENVVILGDFNLGARFHETRADTDIGILRGLETPTPADDLFDAHAQLLTTDRRTHVSGRELDRILLAPRLRDGEGLEFKSVATLRSLAIRGAVDTGRDVDYHLPAAEQDLSDHFPLLVVLAAE